MSNFYLRSSLTLLALVLLGTELLAHDPPSPTEVGDSIPVNATNFIRAETDSYLAMMAAQGYFANFIHIREPTPISEQNVIRQNRDTLYSGAVFDLSSPVTIQMPDNKGRFQSLLVLNQDHFVVGVEHDGGDYIFTQQEAGSRYIAAIVRTFMDPANPEDIEEARQLQDAIGFEQSDTGVFDVPDWDRISLDRTRGLLNALAADMPTDLRGAFGSKGEVDPIVHFIITGAGWGGNPPSAAVYSLITPTGNDGSTPHAVTVKDVPVDGFWSVTVYNEDGFMEANELNAYAINNVTAMRNENGSVTVHFGSCGDGRVNCLPITSGWNYAVRLYRPHEEIIDGRWEFPEPVPVK